VVDVVFERVEVVLDDRDESLVVVPLVVSSDSTVSWSNTLQDVGFSDADERENLVDVRKPEDSGNDDVVAGVTL
jgi:hypothetical protein